MVAKIDVLTEKLGDPGKFQVIAYFCLVSNLLLAETNFLSTAFFAAMTEHHCKLGSGESVEDFVPIVTNKNNEKHWDGCHVYTGSNKTAKTPCKDGWTYYLGEKEVTIISEFNLVCDDAYKADLAGTIFFTGVTLSTFTLGYFADRWGRRPLLAIILLANGCFGIACFLAKSYVAFVVFRFFSGFTTAGIINTSFVLGLELFQTKYRGVSGIFFFMGSTTGGAVLAVVAYLLGDWRYIQLVLSIMSFIQFFMLWLVPESLRWLLSKKKFARAEAVVKKIVVFNNLPFPHEIFDEIKREADSVEQSGLPIKQHKAGYFDLVKNRTLRNRAIILFIVWYSVQVAYYGLAYSISSLFGNKYLNFGISQVVDICSILLITWITSRFGRRGPIALMLSICGVATIGSSITKVIKSDAKEIKIVGTVSAIIGKAAAISCFAILFTFTTELFPTIIRNISVGVTTLGGRVGAMAAPQILLVGVYTTDFVPYSIFGGFALLSGFLIFLLPKTHNKPLVDIIEHTNEFENFDKEVVEQDPECGMSGGHKYLSIVVENRNAIGENLDTPESTQLAKQNKPEHTLPGKLEKIESNPVKNVESASILFENKNATLHENLDKPEPIQLGKCGEVNIIEHTSLEKHDKPETR